MAVISTGNIPKALWPGVRYWFGRQYKEHSPEYTALFEMDTSDKAWEEIVELTGFGLVPVKTQGVATSYDSELQGYTHRLTAVCFSSGFIVTKEEVEDCQYSIVGKRRARALAFSFRQTKETVGANVYNRAFDATSTYIGGDGKELCATDHPTVDGTQSNELAVAADLSESAIEDLCIMIMQATNSKGLAINLKPQSLHIHPSNYFDAQRIYFSPLQSGTANNDLNALNRAGVFPKGIHSNHYFSDSDAWFIRSDCPEGMKGLQRVPISFSPDNDFDTDNLKYKGRERYVFGWADWRQVYGSPGA